MLSSTIMECRSSQWIFSRSSQCVQQIFERLLVMVICQRTKNSFCVSSPSGWQWQGLSWFSTPWFGPFTSWISVFSFEDSTPSLSHYREEVVKAYDTGHMGSPWGLKLACVISYYYENFDSHKFSQMHKAAYI